ncbi:MAG: class I SAM-dependent methyltransferase [Planctomycetota bacterium]
MSSNRAQRGYDRLAPWYGILERCVFGHRLQMARRIVLDSFPTRHRILILGDGDGRLLATMHEQFPTTAFVSVDQSQAMLHRQRQRIQYADRSRVVWLHGDATEMRFPAGSFDGLVTAFFTDCFDLETLKQSMPCWHRWMQSDAVWMHVDFAEPTAWHHRLASATTSFAMHTFFRWQTGLANRNLIDVDPMIRELGWQPTLQRCMVHPFVRGCLYRNQDTNRIDASRPQRTC